MKLVAGISLGIATLTSFLGGACGPNPDPHDPHGSGMKCEGEDRPQLDCTTEFNYDGRKIEGGFSAIGLGGASAKTEQQALRSIDKETEQYAAQSRRLCDEYNKCVIDRTTYSTRSENLRRRMNKAPELLDEVKTAKDDASRRKALAKAYTALVPDDARRELALDFAVMAQRPSDGAPRAISKGESLPTGTKLAFMLQPSRSSYVYLFQKGPDGKITVLFPDTRITTTNPLGAGATLRIPSGAAQTFKLNDKDIGNETVYIVASLEPLAQLGNTTGAPTGALGQVARASDPDAAPNCTRALELDESPPCVRPRGLELDDDAPATPAQPRSFRAHTEAADSVIVQSFTFAHTP